MLPFVVATVSLCLCVMDPVASISVPTGKTTPIEPAEPQPKPVPNSRTAPPAPVYEYTEDRPEPPPLDPSYVPITYNFIEYLSKQRVVLVPMKIKYPKPYTNHEKYPLTAAKYQKLVKNENLRRKYYSNFPQQDNYNNNYIQYNN